MTQPGPAKPSIDLTTLGTAGAAAAQVHPEPFIKTPFDPMPKRESIRGWIAMLLLATLLVVIGTMIGIASYSTISCMDSNPACSTGLLELKPIRSLGEVLLAPLVGLVGAVTGFYYGEKSATERQGAG